MLYAVTFLSIELFCMFDIILPTCKTCQRLSVKILGKLNHLQNLPEVGWHNSGQTSNIYMTNWDDIMGTHAIIYLLIIVVN